MSVHLIVYSSLSLIPPAYADRELTNIVTVSVDRNGRAGVTGALLYSEGRRFAQALEGDASAVRPIMDSIRADTRHTNIVMLHDAPVAQRRFANWAMAFRGQATSIDIIIGSAEYEVALPTNRALGELLGTMERLVAR